MALDSKQVASILLAKEYGHMLSNLAYGMNWGIGKSLVLSLIWNLADGPLTILASVEGLCNSSLSDPFFNFFFK